MARYMAVKVGAAKPTPKEDEHKVMHHGSSLDIWPTNCVSFSPALQQITQSES